MRHILPTVTALVFATSASAQSATIATPAGQWEASSDNGLCRMQRTFGANGVAHLLILEQNAPDRAMGIALAGPSLTGLDPQAPLRVRFTSDDNGFDKRARIAPSNEYGQVAVLNGVWLPGDGLSDEAGPQTGETTRIGAAAARAVEGITVAQGDRTVSFQTGALDDAAQALNKCTAQIMRGWGFDPAVQYALLSRAAPEDPKAMGRSLKGFYKRLARRLVGGPLDLALFIGTDGRVKECRIIVTSNDSALDQAACEALTGEQFKPALHASGQAVASFWTTRINYAPFPGDAARQAQ